MEELAITIESKGKQKEVIIEELRRQGCRITKQRRVILDVILENECSCCKEIFFKASAIDSGIGAATVYRMVNTLEDIGVISRKNMYKVDDGISFADTAGIKECCGILCVKIAEYIINSAEKLKKHRDDAADHINDLTAEIGEFAGRNCKDAEALIRLCELLEGLDITLSDDLQEKIGKLSESERQAVNEYCVLSHWQEILTIAGKYTSVNN